MTRGQLDDAPVDLWIIGHTHRQHPSQNKTGSAEAQPVLIPGTPEPDGFDCSHGGTAWMIEVGIDKKIHLESLSTGTYRFLRTERSLEGAQDLQRLRKELDKQQQTTTLLRLKLNGRLKAEQLAELHEYLNKVEQSFFYAQIEDSGLLERISERSVEAEFTEGSFPYRLLKRLIAEKDFEALQTAYTLLQEQRR
jgi:hypothetical protein